MPSPPPARRVSCRVRRRRGRRHLPVVVCARVTPRAVEGAGWEPPHRRAARSAGVGPAARGSGGGEAGCERRA